MTTQPAPDKPAAKAPATKAAASAQAAPTDKTAIPTPTVRHRGLDGFEVFGATLAVAAVMGVGCNAVLETKPVDDFFNSFTRVPSPEPYCIVKTDASGSHIEIFARSAENNERYGLDQVSAQLYSTDGQNIPLKKGMTGTFASQAGNTVYLRSAGIAGAPRLDKYTSPQEYASVTITGWTQLDGSEGPVGTCSKVGKSGKVGPVWEGMPVRNWLLDPPKAPKQPIKTTDLHNTLG